MPLTEIAVVFSLLVLGMIICSSIMYVSIIRSSSPLVGIGIGGFVMPIILNLVGVSLLPFVTIRDYPQPGYPVPTGPSIAIMVGCWIGLLVGYYAGLQKDQTQDSSCYRCSLILLGAVLVGLLSFILIP